MTSDTQSLFHKLPHKLPIEIKNNLVVGLSGGPDSTFLLYYIKHLRDHFGYDGVVVPIIVDHGLRKESYDEALITQCMSKKLGFDTKIIKIKDKYNSGNLQNWARIKRRDILYEIAKKYSADIILGHHYDDQIETIYMRLIRSSGFDGLIGIKEITNWKEIKVLRPLLRIKKKEILNFLSINKIPYIDDRSNFNLKFERVKTRNVLKLLEKNKYSHFKNKLHNLSIISNRLVDCINKLENLWKKDNVTYYPFGSISINYENFFFIFKKNDVFASYILGKLIKNVGGNNFLPRKLNLISNLIGIFKGELNKFTINNVVISKKSKCLNLIRENRNIKFEKTIFKNKIDFFDNRFVILSKFDGSLVQNKENSSVTINLTNNEIMSKYYKNINFTIPKLQTLEGRVIDPYLYTIDENKINNHLRNVTDFDLIFVKGKN